MPTLQIGVDFKVLRIINNPVNIDSDWHGNNNITGFKANAGVTLIVPKPSQLGILQLGILFIDSAGDPVPGSQNTSVDVTLLQLISPELPDHTFVRDHLLSIATDVRITGDAAAPVPGVFRLHGQIGFQITGTQSLPAGYAKLYLMGRGS